MYNPIWKTTLNNVVLDSNANAGLVVHSTVVANGLETKNNGWGGVNVDKGTPEYPLSFTFDAQSTLNEPLQVWSEITDQTNIVTAPQGWRNYVASVDSKVYAVGRMRP